MSIINISFYKIYFVVLCMLNVNSFPSINASPSDVGDQKLGCVDEAQKVKLTGFAHPADHYLKSHPDSAHGESTNLSSHLKTIDSSPINPLYKDAKNYRNPNWRRENTGKKRKKTKREIQILEDHYKKDPSWGRKTVQELKPQLKHLTVDQIYKWGYDRKLRARKEERKAKQAKKPHKNLKRKEKTSPKIDDSDEKDYNLEVDNLLAAFNEEKSESEISEVTVKENIQIETWKNPVMKNESRYLFDTDSGIDENFFKSLSALQFSLNSVASPNPIDLFSTASSDEGDEEDLGYMRLMKST